MQINYDTVFARVLNMFTNETFLTAFISGIVYFILKIIVGALFFYFGRKILKKILNKYYTSPHFRTIDLSLKTFLSSMIDAGAILFLIGITLLVMGFNHASLIALLGSIGIGIGLALKDNLANFVGGLIILIFKTYLVGDEVYINENLGTINSIDMFSTSILTFDGDIVVIPNGNVVTDQVINYSKTPTRRVKIVASVPLNSDIDYAFTVLKNLMMENEKVLKDPAPFVNIDKYTPYSIQIVLKAWTKNADYWNTYFELQRKLKAHLEAHNLSIPHPKLDINFQRDRVVTKTKEENKKR